MKRGLANICAHYRAPASKLGPLRRTQGGVHRVGPAAHQPAIRLRAKSRLAPRPRWIRAGELQEQPLKFFSYAPPKRPSEKEAEAQTR